MANNFIANSAVHPQVVSQSEMHSQQQSPDELFDYVCRCLGFSREQMQALRQFTPTQIMQLQTALPDVVACAPKLRECIPALNHVAACAPQIGNFKSVVDRCRSLEDVVRDACCPGNVAFGDIGNHFFSSKNTLYLKNVAQNFGADYVNSFPVPPNKKIRLEQGRFSGFVPELVEMHFTMANGGTNYLNIEVNFFVGETHIGSEMLGSTFRDEDGRTKKVAFPTWRGKSGILIGYQERVAVELSITGPNNLEFATVAIHVDAEAWARLCLPQDSPSCR